jgi:hypothetical protein
MPSDREDELAAIERFIATKEPTRCPPAFAVPTPNAAMTLAEEEARLRGVAIDRPLTRFEKQAAKKRWRDGDRPSKPAAPKQAVVHKGRGKAITYEGVAYSSRMELARALVPVLGRTEGGIQQLLIKFDNDPVAAVNYADSARKRRPKASPGA